MNGVVLVVDDDQVSVQVISAILTKNHYCVVSAGNGKEAMEYLYQPNHQVDLVIVDYMMPVMDGLAFLSEYKNRKANNIVPVIMVTGESSIGTAEQAIMSGVCHYLQKPVEEKMLMPMVRQAIKNYKQHKELCDIASQQDDVKPMLRRVVFKLRHLHEVRPLAHFLAGFYPDPKQAIIGIYEILLNAVEHGTLGIDFEQKKQLLASGKWDDEVSYRQGVTPYSERCVSVMLEMLPDTIALTVEDEGEGFDSGYVLEAGIRAPGDTNGRGVNIAKEMSFDRLEYNRKGNKVVCIKKL